MIDIKTVKMGQRVYFSHFRYRVYCGEVYHVSLLDMRGMNKLSELEMNDKYGFILVNNYDVISDIKLDREFLVTGCYNCFNSIDECVNNSIRVYIAYGIESIRLRIESYEHTILRLKNKNDIDSYRNMILDCEEQILKYKNASLEVDNLYGINEFRYISE